MKKIILIGGGGHCRSCIDVIKLENKYSIEGILDAEEQIGNMIDGYPILGNDERIDEFVEKGFHFLITVGQIKSVQIRQSLFEKLLQKNASIAVVISPKAHVSTNAKIGIGTIVLHGAIINAGADIGQNAIINSLSLIEHDTKIGNHTHVSTGALINGTCTIGNKSFIGSGVVVANNINIADNVVVGAGSLVRKNIAESGRFAGNPIKMIKSE